MGYRLFKHLVFPRRMELYLFFHSEADLRSAVVFQLLSEICPYDLERKRLLCLPWDLYPQIFRGLWDFP